MERVAKKNEDLYKSVQINKVCFIAAIVLISCFISACAGNHAGNHTTISAEEIEQYRDNQQKWLSSLQEGMSPEDALRKVLSYQHYFFQYKENGKLFQYMQGQYPITGMLFGLFFEDGRLTSLMLDQAVYDFHWCRYNLYRLHRAHWLPIGFQTAAIWIRLQSRLGDEYDDVSTAYQTPTDYSGVADAVEIITHLPLAAIALPFLVVTPFLPEDKIAEGPDEIAGDPDEVLLHSYGRPEQLREVAIQIELGVTTDIELMRLLGAPDYKGEQSGLWIYRSPKIQLGIVDGTVSWSESWSWDSRIPLNNTITSNKYFRCEPSN